MSAADVLGSLVKHARQLLEAEACTATARGYSVTLIRPRRSTCGKHGKQWQQQHQDQPTRRPMPAHAATRAPGPALHAAQSTAFTSHTALAHR